MRVDFDYKHGLDELVADVLRSERICEDEQKKLMKEIGKTIKDEVVQILPKSEVGGKHKHMKDDVKVTVTGGKDGTSGVIVHGGKDTAYKWHMLDDGTRNPDGSVHTPAIHFTDKAMKRAESTIEKMLDDLEKRIAND